jgi:hypothetical protein
MRKGYSPGMRLRERFFKKENKRLAQIQRKRKKKGDSKIGKGAAKRTEGMASHLISVQEKGKSRGI